MRKIVLTMALGWWAGGDNLLQAGLYSVSEPPEGRLLLEKAKLPLRFSQFQEQLRSLIQIKTSFPESEVRKEYLKRLANLEARPRLSVDEQVDLSYYQIRLGQYEKAIQLLVPIARGSRNVMVSANLATAYQIIGQLDQAQEYLRQVKSFWPSQPPAGISPAQWDWYKRVESYHFNLVALRYRENPRPSARPKPPDTVDNLFGVNFVGDSGRYEAGKMAAAQHDRLPKDALAIVQQLLIWLPDDSRLYWLLGELLNAQGDVASAAAVFAEGRDNRRLDAVALQEHRQIVQESLAQTVLVQPEILPSTAPSSDWFSEHRHVVLVGGGVGLVVVLLAYLQFREIRWRRQNKTRGSKTGR